MDENTYELIINSAKHPMGIAKIAEVIFNGKYKVHIIQRRVTWFEKEDDGTFEVVCIRPMNIKNGHLKN